MDPTGDELGNPNSTDTSDGGGISQYDPELPVLYGHQTMELVFICVLNALSVITIVCRIYYNRVTLQRFRKADIWIAAAGVLLKFPYWACQIGMNRHGSGLHPNNIPTDWEEPFWRFSWGWAAYYLITSMIKVSVCAFLLEMLTFTFQKSRMVVYTVAALIMSLGIAEVLVWLLQSQPIMSNFDYSVKPEWSVDIDWTRYCWVGLSVMFDVTLVLVPLRMLKQSLTIKKHERLALWVVSGANLLGTLVCLVGIYGIWTNRTTSMDMDPYTETPLAIINDWEILTYAIGASVSAFSRRLVSVIAKIPVFRPAPRSIYVPTWRNVSIQSTFDGTRESDKELADLIVPTATIRGVEDTKKWIHPNVDFTPGLDAGGRSDWHTATYRKGWN